MADGSNPSKRPLDGATEPCLAKLFMHGGSQAVRLPKAFRFTGTEVAVRRDGEAVVLEPVKPNRPPTREEMDAFWRDLDAKYGDLDWGHAERDKSPARDLPGW